MRNVCLLMESYPFPPPFIINIKVLTEHYTYIIDVSTEP